MPDETAWYPEQAWSLDPEWYEVTSGGTLRQCDILIGGRFFESPGTAVPTHSVHHATSQNRLL